MYGTRTRKLGAYLVSWFIIIIYLLYYPLHLLLTHAYSVLKHIYVGNLFQSFTTLWENVYFLISRDLIKLEWPCPLVLLSFFMKTFYLLDARETSGNWTRTFSFRRNSTWLHICAAAMVSITRQWNDPSWYLLKVNAELLRKPTDLLRSYFSLPGSDMDPSQWLAGSIYPNWEAYNFLICQNIQLTWLNNINVAFSQKRSYHRAMSHIWLSPLRHVLNMNRTSLPLNLFVCLFEVYLYSVLYSFSKWPCVHTDK